MSTPREGGPARRRRRSPTTPDPAAPLVRTPVGLGAVDVGELLRELVGLHETGGDPYAYRMPEPEPDLVHGVLRHAAAHNRSLRPAEIRRRAALIRVTLVQYLIETAPARQSAAARDALDAGAGLDDLAGPLGLAGRRPSSVHNRLKSLRAVELGAGADGRPVRRTPEAVRAEEERRAREEREARIRTQVAVEEFAAVRDRAVALLRRREEIEAADRPDETGELWAAWWLDEIATLLEGGRLTQTGPRALASAVDALTRHVAKHGPGTSA